MTTTTTTTTPKTRNSKGKLPAPRVEQLAAIATTDMTESVLSHADSAPAIEAQPAAEAPAVESPVSPEVAALIAKEEAKAKKAAAELERRNARIAAYKAGQPIPPANGKGLPPVVKDERARRSGSQPAPRR